MLTYDQLRDAMQKWQENYDADFMAEIDTCIRIAENRIVTAVRLPNFSKTAGLTISQYQSVTPLPADLLAVDSIHRPLYGPMLKKDAEFIYECYGDSVQGAPRFFAVIDDSNVMWGPTPDQQYGVVLRYFNVPVSLCDQHDGTYISNTYPAALHAGANWQAALFSKDWEAAQVYKSMFDESLGSAAKVTFGPYTKQRHEKTSAAVDGVNDLGRPQ